MTDTDEIKAVIAIWERTIDTQKHFNDLSLRTRQLGVTIVGAMLGVGFIVRPSVQPLYIHGIEFPVLSIACVAAAAMMYMTKVLDVDVYHKMLQGAVAFNEDIEEKHLTKFLDMQQGLSQTITVYSRYKDARRHRDDGNGTLKHDGKKKESLKDRMARFYKVSAGALVLLGVVVAVSANLNHSNPTVRTVHAVKSRAYAKR